MPGQHPPGWEMPLGSSNKEDPHMASHPRSCCATWRAPRIQCQALPTEPIGCQRPVPKARGREGLGELLVTQQGCCLHRCPPRHSGAEVGS